MPPHPTHTRTPTLINFSLLFSHYEILYLSLSLNCFVAFLFQFLFPCNLFSLCCFFSVNPSDLKIFQLTNALATTTGTTISKPTDKEKSWPI